jgi:hypothetical protein
MSFASQLERVLGVHPRMVLARSTAKTDSGTSMVRPPFQSIFNFTFSKASRLVTTSTKLRPYQLPILKIRMPPLLTS